MMSDNADIANELIEKRLQAGIAKVPKLQGQSAVECIECGAAIPELRRVALPGVQTCISCQSELELAARRFGR